MPRPGGGGRMAKDDARWIRALWGSALLLAGALVSLLWGLGHHTAGEAVLLLGSCAGFLPGVLLRRAAGGASPPWRGWRLVAACAIPSVTLVVVAIPWLLPGAFEDAKHDLRWPNAVACLAMLPLTVVCVLIRHPPSSYVRDALEAVVGIWVLLLTWALNFDATGLGKNSYAWELLHQFLRGFGIHFEGVVVFMWISSLMVRRRSELEERPTWASKYSRSLLGAMAGAYHSQGFLVLQMKKLKPGQEASTVGVYLTCAILFLTIWTAYTVLAAQVIGQNIAMLQREVSRVRGAARAESAWAAHTLGFDLGACLTLGLTTTLFWGLVVVRKICGWCGHPLGSEWLLTVATIHRTDLIINGLSVAVLSNLLWQPGNKCPIPRLRSQVTVPGMISAGDAEVWMLKVEQLAGRGVLFRDVIGFWGLLLRGEVMPSFDPARSTTNDVVRQAIIPMSRDELGGGGRALASVWSNGVPMQPTRMVTHNWSNLFLHLLAGIAADVVDESCYDKVARQLLSARGVEEVKRTAERKGTLETVYWVCAFSINQHAGICAGFGQPPAPGAPQRAAWERTRRDSVTQLPYTPCRCLEEKMFNNDQPDLCEMNKFDDMMRLLKHQVRGFRHLVVVDEQFQVFHRAWCVAEIVEAILSNIPQRIKIHSRDALDRHYKSLSFLDVRDCEASRAEDKDMILANIKDKDAFNSHLQWAIFGTEALFTTWVDGQHHAELIGRILRRVRSARGTFANDRDVGYFEV